MIAASGVVFTQDGGVVFEVPTTPTVRTIYRLAPGATQAQSLMTIEGPAPSFNGYLHSLLGAAGPGSGFLVSKYLQGPVTRCCFAGRSQASVTYYPVAGGPGTVLRHCEQDCNPYECGDEQVLPPGDDSAVLLGPNTPACPTAGAWAVHDIASGAETPVNDVPTEFQQLAGRYISGSDLTNGTVVDWTTGQKVLTVPNMRHHALLPDGSVLYAEYDKASNPVMRMAPGDATPTPTGATGGVLAVVAGHVLTTSDSYYYPQTLTVWDGGTSLGSVDDVGSQATFDGARVAFLDQACLTTRLQIWQVGNSPPERLPKRCGQPRVAGPAKLAKRTARLVLRCPIATAQGCMGTISLQRPWIGSERRFALGPGTQTSAVVAARLNAGSCRRLRASRTWRVAITVPPEDSTVAPDKLSRQWTVRRTGTC